MRHLKLLHPSLQALCGQAGFFGWQLVLCRLKPPEERAREAAELKQLLLAGLDGGKPERETHIAMKNKQRRKELMIKG